MAWILGLDVGTSSTKGVVVDESGRVVRTATVSYALQSPQTNWFEQDPADWIAATHSVMRELEGFQFQAIGITGQMHGLVALDETNRPLRYAILWNDQRTSGELAEWEALIGAERLRQILRNAPMTGLTAPKLLWMRRYEPELFAKLSRISLPKDYVAWSLTGKWGTDRAEASGTGLFDVGELRWSAAMCESLAFETGWLPPECGFGQALGETANGVPVFLAGGDQAAGAFGMGCAREGVFSLSLGSSATLVAPSRRPADGSSPSLNCFGAIAPEWLVMGCSLNGTLALEAVRNLFFAGESIERIEALAQSAPSGANGTRLTPHFGGERCPVNDASATARLDGLSSATTPADLARATYEGIVENVAAMDRQVREVAGPASVYRASGGGSKSDFWLQMFADKLGTPVERAATGEGPAFGAALVAGLGASLWPSVEALPESVFATTRRFEPS